MTKGKVNLGTNMGQGESELSNKWQIKEMLTAYSDLLSKLERPPNSN